MDAQAPAVGVEQQLAEDAGRAQDALNDPENEVETTIEPQEAKNEAPPSTEEVFDPTDIIRGTTGVAIASTTGNETVLSPETEVNKPDKLPIPEVSEAASERMTDDTDVVKAAVMTKPGEPAEDTLSVHSVQLVEKLVKPDPERLWAQLFGSRYENDDDIQSQTHANKHESSSPIPPANRLSLKLKLDRRLDEQIQSMRTKYRERVMLEHDPNASSPPRSTRRRRSPRAQSALEIKPFKRAGLSSTTVRFCLERALQKTCQCVQTLHAIAQGEPTPSKYDVEHGVLVTQWELDVILQRLFAKGAVDDPDARKTALLLLDNPDYRFPLHTLLQVSWFLPFEQFGRLRSLIAQVSRKHLCEKKLAIVNSTLRYQLLLLPHSSQLQSLVLKVVESIKATPSATRSTQESALDPLINAFLYGFRVPRHEPHALEKMNIVEFMQLSPSDLAARFALTSVLVVQRVVFARFLVEEIAQVYEPPPAHLSWYTPPVTTRQTSVSSAAATDTTSTTAAAKPTKKRKPSRIQQTRSAERLSARKAKIIFKTTTTEGDEETSHTSETQSVSVSATQGSCSTVVNATVQPSGPPDSSAQTDTTTQLRTQLEDALRELRESMPWVLDGDLDSNESAAIRATYVGADAFRQSFNALNSTETEPESSTKLKIHAFIDSIHAITQETALKHNSPPKTPIKKHWTPPPRYVLPGRHSPYQVQRPDPQTAFPPPYSVTKPAYWTFDPAIPTDSPSKTPLMDPYKPGVGDYDVQKGDRLTFQRSPGFAFASKTSEQENKSPMPSHTSKNSTKTVSSTSKPREVEDPGPPSYQPEDAVDKATSTEAHDVEPCPYEATEDDRALEEQLRDVYRRQQSIAVDDLVSTLLSQRPQTMRSWWPPQQKHKPKPKGKPQSTFVSRMRRSVHEKPAPPATVASPKPRLSPQKAVSPPPYTDIKQPPRDFEPPVDDQHLQWASRVSELHKAKLRVAMND
ncbi:hypothetical protein Poli38472_003500 [Pythium oligandrum]|uniref:Uncharacterized protein n=1 Tax=Pythium oligandrum TaxID=41045 RepID=A0A8K1C773_PYTOL|nr:hypothetical protein Poli38472_003500 [Pythium oligandrum]|eukprot:TMW57575.1 hypothetical protein Poli38472_003500 [Pythium oligandrum]